MHYFIFTDPFRRELHFSATIPGSRKVICTWIGADSRREQGWKGRGKWISGTYFYRTWTHVHVRYMLSPVRLSSVTFARPTQAVQIFGNNSTALGTLAIHWHPLKISRTSSQGNPSAGALNTRGVAKYSDFGSIDGYISETVQDRRRLLLITNRKSYKLSTGTKIGDLEWPWTA